MNNLRHKSSNPAYFSAILLIAATFAAACNSAAPPRSSEMSAGSATARSTPKPIPPRDQQAIESASNVQITKLDGATFKLTDYRGKVLVVDFWRTDCPPCVRLIPHLAELSKKYRDKGLEVVGLTSDRREDEKLVVEFLKERGADYTVGYENQWLSSAFLKGTDDELGPPIPQVFVISREGRVVEHIIGETPGGKERLEQVVNQQLASR
jgi:thiol-disulfide isomerase/thioredoxin